MLLEPSKDAPQPLQEQWTPDRIKVETELFLLDGGKLSPLSFKRRNREDLLNCIVESYPGGLEALQEELKNFVTDKRTGEQKRITKELLA